MVGEPTPTLLPQAIDLILVYCTVQDLVWVWPDESREAPHEAAAQAPTISPFLESLPEGDCCASALWLQKCSLAQLMLAASP